jgi:alanyl-tRNA synthetase
MTAKELRERYLNFFKKRGHAIIPSAPIVPENNPTALYIVGGMQPLVPYLMGEKHPEGKRLANVQKCLRTNDIDEVGDTMHHTFFEMLGNWSLGDYWKKESINWSYEFLVDELGINPKKLWVTCFAGDKDAPKDEETERTWKNLGIQEEKIYFLGKEDNWWGPVGTSGPCGPDTEIFYDTSGKPHGSNCAPGDNCGRFFEIWNNVFMQYNKLENGKYEPLEQKNVDTGMGVERTVAVLSGFDDNYLVNDLWENILSKIESLTSKNYKGNERAFRVIADHVRGAVFIIADGVVPSNKDRGYILRRLIRRAVRFGRVLGVDKPFITAVSKAVVDTYKEQYRELESQKSKIEEELTLEEKRFLTTLEKGLREIGKIGKLDAKIAFNLYETYGFPLELTEEIAEEKGQNINKDSFEKEFEKHKSLSRTASAGMFKGGLADKSEEVTKLHTATHLLHASLRKVLGEHVQQKGSNITAERLRFDFSHKEKLSDKEIKKVEKLVNEAVDKNLQVAYETKTFKEAIEEGALAFFGEKYGEKVKVYTVGDSQGKYFSKEVCGGPHVKRTSEIGRVRIKKQDKIGSGSIRIYAVLEN